LTNHHIPDILRFLAFAILNVIFGYNRVRFTTDYKLYGWLTIANGGVCLLLAPRTNLFSTLLRIPGPVLLTYHRYVGFATILHATIHWGATAAHYVRTNQLAATLGSTFTRWGLVSWACLMIIALTALPRIVRRKSFELFYYAHFFFLLFVIGACLHAKHSPEFLLPGLGLWVLDRAVRFAYNFRTVTPLSVVHYPGGVTKFKLEGVQVTRPNQMAWVQLPGVSFLNWHPFTIASAPGDSHATIAIRGLGGFTNKVQGLALDAHSCHGGNEKSGGAVTSAVLIPRQQVKIRVDGPYGHGGLLWEQYPVVVLVAGGIGITPAISIASHIVRRASSAASCDRSPAVRGQGWHVHLLWAIKDIQHAQWFEEEMTELARVIAETNAPVTLDISIFASGSGRRKAGLGSEEESMAGGGAVEQGYAFRGPATVYEGRPDVLGWMSDVKERRRGLDAAVSLCGPRPLIDGARKAAARVSGDMGLFHVEEEVFEF